LNRRMFLLAPGVALVGTLGLSTSAHPAAAAAASVPYHQPALMYNIPNTAAINGFTSVIKPAIQPPPVLACLPVTPPSPIPGWCPPLHRRASRGPATWPTSAATCRSTHTSI
jgi:hypothetical protein